MKIYDGANKELMSVRAIERDGDTLVIKGKIFGAMPMTARLRPEEARAALRMLDLKLVWFLVTLLFRPAAEAKPPKAGAAGPKGRAEPGSQPSAPKLGKD